MIYMGLYVWGSLCFDYFFNLTISQYQMSLESKTDIFYKYIKDLLAKNETEQIMIGLVGKEI